MLLCASTERVTLADLNPPNERRRKARQSERLNREGHGVQARLVKTFRKVGDGKKATADL